MTNRWSAAKGNTVYSYDNVGKLTFVDYPSSPDITLQYNALNRLTNMVDAAGTTKFTYYAGGLLNTEDGPWASDTVTYTYNNARLRSGLSLQQPTGTWTNGFTYDAAHRLSTVTSPAGTFTYSYKVGQASRLPIKLALPNTSYITNTYDSVARLTGTYLDNSANTVLDKSEYLYNTGNQRIRQMRTDGSYYTNNYDNIGQLKVADSTVASEDRGYLYDGAWNLNVRTNNGATTTFNVDVKNQLTSVGGLTCTYDSNGNITSSASGITYVYDDENQLKTWQNSTVAKTDFVYDGLSRRRQRLEYTWNGSSWVLGQTVNSIYVGMRVIQERDGRNLPTVSYTQGSDLSSSLEGAGGIGGLLARSHGYSSGNWSTHNSYHADGGGNITYMVDSSQAMVASYRYDPFGNTISSSGTLASANVYRFSSKEVHLNSGMYYYGYRWYDPSFQRWLNRDPLGDDTCFENYSMRFSQPQRARLARAAMDNLYTFVRNNAVDNIDSLGLDIFFIGEIPPELLQEALRLNGGRYRVNLPDGRRVDLAGRPHGGVPTPHTACPRPPNPPPYDIYPPGHYDPVPSTLGDILDSLIHLGSSLFEGFFYQPPPPPPPIWIELERRWSFQSDLQ